MKAEIIHALDLEFLKVGKSRLDTYLGKTIKQEAFTLLVCRAGVAKISIDLKEYILTEHSELILMPFVNFRVDYISEGFNVEYVVVEFALLRRALFNLNPKFIGFMRKHPFYCFNENSIKGLNLTIDGFKYIYKDDKNQFQESIAHNILENFFMDFYDKVSRHVESLDTDGTFRQEEHFKRFMGLVLQNCKTTRDVTFYASQLCLSTRYLSHIVRSVTGKTVKDIINEHVIMEIKVLLHSTNVSLQAIADAMHFPSQSFLGNFFKKYTGMSPSKWRDEHRK